MCLNCVAGSVPYVGAAVGGLKLLSWRARTRAERSQPVAGAGTPDAAMPVPAGGSGSTGS